MWSVTLPQRLQLLLRLLPPIGTIAQLQELITVLLQFRPVKVGDEENDFGGRPGLLVAVVTHSAHCQQGDDDQASQGLGTPAGVLPGPLAAFYQRWGALESQVSAAQGSAAHAYGQQHYGHQARIALPQLDKSHHRRDKGDEPRNPAGELLDGIKPVTIVVSHL